MTSTRRTIRDGLVVGFIAAVSVALFYAVFDFLAARGTFFTVDLLGKAVFRGLRDPSVLLLPVRPDPGVILEYNALHLVVALCIGLVVTGLVEYAERHPARGRAVAVVIVGGYFVTIGVVGVLLGPIRALVPWWSVVVANALATLLAGAYLMWKRPGIGRRLLGPGRPRVVLGPDGRRG